MAKRVVKVVKTDVLGVCCHCQSEEISFEKPNFVDDKIVFPYTCLECNGKGQEVYTLEFVKNVPEE